MSDQAIRLVESMAAGTDTATVQQTDGTIVRLTLSSEDFLLQDTLEAVPDATFVCEQLVASDPRNILPLLWAHSSDHTDLEAALAADSSVERASVLAEVKDRRLYQIDWDTHVDFFIQLIANAHTTILDLVGTADGWSMQLFAPSRGELSASLDVAEFHAISFEIDSIRDLDRGQADDCRLRPGGSGALGAYDLSAKQVAAVEAAYEHGYYEIPREVTVEDLAEILEISHQALSERLRRGHKAVLAEILMEHPAFEGSGS